MFRKKNFQIPWDRTLEKISDRKCSLGYSEKEKSFWYLRYYWNHLDDFQISLLYMTLTFAFLSPLFAYGDFLCSIISGKKNIFLMASEYFCDYCFNHIFVVEYFWKTNLIRNSIIQLQGNRLDMNVKRWQNHAMKLNKVWSNTLLKQT